MAINFDGPRFAALPIKQRRQIVKEEFLKCSESFEYYIKNYAYIRHPNKGIIKMEPFEFQLDIANPIATALVYKRGEGTLDKIKRTNSIFNYETWWNELAEEQIELAKKVPSEFHEYYRVTRHHEEYHNRIDTVILKSRQTGISTTFEQVGVWHGNFHVGIYDLIVSQSDREAKKFLNDIIGSYELIPAQLRAKKLNANEHELWLSITGDKSHKSGLQALPPTANAGRGYSPNLVILDEFAQYRKAEELWNAITFAVSGGGIIVIISTPRGVGNLYHKIWTMTNKSLSFSLSNTALDMIVTPENQKEEDLDIAEQDMMLSAFRPAVIHWTQMPESEFRRRGFKSAIGWYRHMRSKISLESGQKGVAQELDLDFVSSGDTIESVYLETMKALALESQTQPFVTEKGLVVYEEPEDNTEYMIGVDVAEGVGEDASDFHVAKIAPRTAGTPPKIVAKFSSNRHSVFRFKEIVKAVAEWYNNAWMIVERNNHGHVLLAYFVDSNEYNQHLIMNHYDFRTSNFRRETKGWFTSGDTRGILIATLMNQIATSNGYLSLPLSTVHEFSTFVLNNAGKWEAMRGFHDDSIFSYSLLLQGDALLPKYKEKLKEWIGEYNAADIDDDDIIQSSLLDETDEDQIEVKKAPPGWLPFDDIRLPELSQRYHDDKENITEKLPVTLKNAPKVFSQLMPIEEEEELYTY